MTKNFLFLTLFILFSLARPALLSAQDQDPSIQERASIADQIEELNQTYQGQMLEYRDSEKQWLIDQGQYRNLKTLLALQTAIKSSRETMSLRRQVITTYLTLLKLKLVEATGIESQLKQQTLDKLEILLSALDQHQLLINQIDTPETLVSAQEEFIQLLPQAEELDYRSRLLLQVGRLQVASDKVEQLRDELSLQTASLSSQTMLNPEKSLEEIDKKITSTKSLLINLNLQLTNEKTNYSAKSRYNQAQKDINTVYAFLVQNSNFLSEMINNLFKP